MMFHWRSFWSAGLFFVLVVVSLVSLFVFVVNVDIDVLVATMMSWSSLSPSSWPSSSSLEPSKQQTTQHPHVISRPGSQGLIVAARSVFFTLVLLLLITYVFSIAMSQLSENTRLEEKYFPTMPQAVLTLIATWRANSLPCT